MKGGFKIRKELKSKFFIAYSILKERILTGEYKYGQILSANSLSKDLEMSRSPILDAFKQLEYDNLVTVSPQLGVIVNPLNIDDIRGKYIALSVLEGVLAGEAAKKGTLEAKQKLMQVNDEIKQKIDDNSAYGSLNQEFHKLIRSMADVRYINELIHQMLIDTRSSGLEKRVFNQEYKYRSWQEHEKIAKSIMDGNAERARNLMESHIHQTREQFLLVLLKKENELSAK